MGILKLKTWEPQTYILSEQIVLSMEMKRLNPAEAMAVRRLAAGMFGELGDMALAEAKAEEAGGLAPSEKAKLVVKAADALPPDEVKEAFTRYVRNVGVVGGGALELDDVPVATGAQLYEIADPSLQTFVVSRLATLSKLSDQEGKGFGSPSTSATAAEGHPHNERPSTSPVLDADFIGDEGGPKPSTAAEPSAQPSSSGSGA